MPQFKTDIIKPNNPGLTYTTPKAMPAKFSNLGAGAQLADSAIKGAIAFDEMNVMKTAEERAKQLSDTYLNNSPSEVNYYQEQKQTAIENLTVDKDNPLFLDMLDKAESKLELAFEQGAISGYEFTQRSKVVADEIMSNNPAYADEIMAKMNDVYARTGVMDTIKIDDAVLKAQNNAKEKAYEGMVTFLETKDIPMAGQSFEDVKKEYINYGEEVRDVVNFKLNINGLKYLNENERAEAREEIQKSPGGVYGRVNKALDVYQNDIDDILLKPISNDEKRKELNILQSDNNNTLGAMVELLGKDEYNTMYSTNIDSIKQMHTTALKIVSGESNALDLKNNKDIGIWTNELKLRTTYNPELQKSNSNKRII